MIHIEEAEKSSRLQRLLWTKEYICLEDENVIVESSFVLEDRYGNALKMVRAGLCWHTFVLAEYNSHCKTKREEIVIFDSRNHRFGSSSCQYEGLDDMELMWLLPLENIHLTVSKKASRHGLCVLRLRFCTGKLFHLELAEGTGARQIWGTWMHCVGELKKKHGPGFHEAESHLTVSDVGKEIQVNTMNQTSVGEAQESNDAHLIPISAGEARGKASNALLSESRHRNYHKENESLAMHLVSHFKDHMTFPPTNDSLHNVHHSHSLQPIDVTLATEELKDQTSSSEVPTTESSGSAMSIMSAKRLLEELDLASLSTICLCVGDLFGQFIFEAGTCGLPKRMASMSTMRHFIEADDCNMDSTDTHFGFGIEKTSLRHCSSLPCVLDGEALFIEDLKQADSLTHQTSLAYLDLANEDDSKQAHVINGHVMLITREEGLLYKEVERHRQQPMDLRFATARHPDVLRKTHKMREKVSVRRGGMANISDKLNEQIQILTHLHVSKHPRVSNTTLDSHKRRKSKKDVFKSFLKSMKKSKKRSRSNVMLPPSHTNSSHVYEYVNEIDIDDIARELTAIDSELFLRIHEAELIDCMWLKPERHSKAPNAMASIEFFHRLFGIVVTEILLPIQPDERAHLFAKFTRIAQRCLHLKNFHSTKAIVTAFQAPALQRLKDTWGCFQRMFPESYCLWETISKMMSDEATNEIYTEHLRRAMDAPPCLPFIGTFLKQITEYYMRKHSSSFYASSHNVENTSLSSRSVTSSLPWLRHSTESAIEPIRRLDGDDYFYTPSGSETDQEVDFDKDCKSISLASAADPTKVPPPSDMLTVCMTTARKRHIQFLIIRYAKDEAQRRGMTWNPKGHSDNQATWDTVLDQTFDWSNIFKTVAEVKGEQGEPKHNFSDLKLMAEEQATAGPSLKTITSEPALTSTLFHFQLCVVKYKLKSNSDVRDFLLKAHYNSDVENFALSLRREPPN